MFSHYEQCPRCVEKGKDSRGDNLGCYRDGGKHCWSCSYHVHPPMSSRWTVPVDKDQDSKVKRILPDDFTWDVPARCWEWLLQYGLPYDYWKGIVGWSEKYQRMVFRVNNPMQFSIGRYLPNSKDSLHAGMGEKRKWHVWGDSHAFVGSLGTPKQTTTLVEDFISGHKVSMVDHTVCLFGTRIYPIHVEYLRQIGKPINLWLDNDQRDNMIKKAANLNMLTGLPVNIINSIKDPKEYNHEEIRNYLSIGSN